MFDNELNSLLYIINATQSTLVTLTVLLGGAAFALAKGPGLYGWLRSTFKGEGNPVTADPNEQIVIVNEGVTIEKQSNTALEEDQTLPKKDKLNPDPWVVRALLHPTIVVAAISLLGLVFVTVFQANILAQAQELAYHEREAVKNATLQKKSILFAVETAHLLERQLTIWYKIREEYFLYSALGDKTASCATGYVRELATELKTEIELITKSSDWTDALNDLPETQRKALGYYLITANREAPRLAEVLQREEYSTIDKNNCADFTAEIIGADFPDTTDSIQFQTKRLLSELKSSLN